MASARTSIAFSAVANFSQLALSLVLLVVATRWLDAAEIGAFVFANAVFLLLEPVRMFQLIAYVIQAKELDDALMRRVQFAGLVLTLGVVTVAVVTGLALRLLFADPVVGDLLIVMAAAYPVKALTQPALAVLNRRMRFGYVTVANVGGSALKVVVTIGLLFGGMRAEALAIGIVAEVLAELAFLFAVERRLALPRPSAAGTRELWAYCSRFSGAQLVSVLPNSAIDLIIGSFLGLAAAGFFNRASRLIRLLRSGIEGTIFPVALAVFGRSERQDRATTRATYLAGLALLTGVTWSALALVIAVAEPLVLLAYGPRWDVIVPLVQILALSAIIFATTAMAPPLFATIGAVDSLFKRNLLIQIPRLLIVLAAVQLDLTAVAWGTVVAMILANLVTEAMLRRELDLAYRHLGAALWRSGLMALACAVPPWLVLQMPTVERLPAYLQLALVLPLGGLCWLLALAVLRHPLGGELQLLLRKLRRSAAS